MCQLLYIALVMLVAGMLGGIVNSFLADPDDGHRLTRFQHIMLGITASFMVPLFLNMISGDLIDKIRGVDGKVADYSKLFVLAGFCLVAAVSSRAFIRSISERILQEVKAANEKAKEAKEEAAEAKAAVEPFVEPDVSDIPDLFDALVASERPATEAEELKVLQAMTNSAYSVRSITGIAKDSGLTKSIVNCALSTLLQRGLIMQTVHSKSGHPRWYPTPEGRKKAVSVN